MFNYNNIRSINDVVKLSNGVLMPWFGLGVWQASGEEVVDAVKWAIDDGGYRQIDGAAVYGNEEEVGLGIKNASVSRKDIFLTSKLVENSYEAAISHCEKSLQDLQTDYLDLYLIHWPRPYEGEGYVDAWKGLEKLYKDGKVRAIGVANFLVEHLETLKEKCDIVPMINQFEYHPYYQRRDLQAYCKENGIQYQAYSPLAGGAVFKDEAFKPLAEKYGKSVAQIILRFELQTGAIVIPKSVKKERILDNAKIFDFELDAADMQTIIDMDQNIKVTCADPNQQWPDFMAEKQARLDAGAPF